MEALRKISVALKCFVCNDRFKNPKTLDCEHTYCENCIKAVDNKVVCPICVRVTPLLNGVSGLKVNHLILQISDILHQDVQFKSYSTPDHICELCVDDYRDPVVAYCNECQRSLCEHHLINHKRTKDTTAHDISLIDSEPVDDVLKETEDEEVSNQKNKKRKHDKRSQRSRMTLKDMIKHIKQHPNVDPRSHREVVVRALIGLNGRGTRAQVTDYIKKHYPEVVASSNARQWENSIAGILSGYHNWFIKRPTLNSQCEWVLADEDFLKLLSSNAKAKAAKSSEKEVTKSRKKAKITKEEEDDKKLCKESIPSPDINIHRSESGESDNDCVLVDTSTSLLEELDLPLLPEPEEHTPFHSTLTRDIRFNFDEDFTL